MPRQPHEQPIFPLWSPPPPAGGVCGGCAACGGAFKEAPPLLKLGARRAVPLRAREDARSVFEGTTPPPPPPAPSSCRECPARAAVRGRGFPCASSCASRSVSGGREEDWGSQLFSATVSPVPETLALSRGPRHRCRLLLLPTPTGAYPFRAALQPRLSPFYPRGLGPDVSPASPRPRASGEELPPPAPVPRPPAAPNPAPRARRHE